MRKQLYRLLSLLLCLSLALTGLLGTLSACAPDNEKQPPDDAEETPTVTLIDGSTEYTVLRPELATKSVVMAAAQLRSALEAATGVFIDIQSDYLERGAAVPEGTCEILVGVTNRPESEQVHATLKEGEYAIELIGNRLVIVGYDDDCTVAAVDAFLTTVMGQNAEAGTYTASKLVLEQDYAFKGTYTPAPPPVVVPTYETIYPDQNKPTVSPASYVRPHYSMENGLYVQSYEAFDLSGVRTTFQTGNMYAVNKSVQSDSVMVYSTSGAAFDSWYQSENFVVDMMIAVNRANKDYLDRDPDNYNDIQMDAGGNYLEHSTGGSFYMVPSENWIEYVWNDMLLPMIEQYHPQTIALEEPEMWIRSGYSESFKQEWEDFYGEEWQSPASSAAANLKANLLKTYLFERILSELCARVEQISPNTQIYIATHSTVNYAAWSINAGLNTYLALGCIDGVIGQTWSDTHNSNFPYNGSNVNDNFTNAFIEYASYVDSVEGTNFYALADPMMDNTSRTEEGCRYMYRQSIAAQLMQPEIHRFEILPWVDRAFETVSGEYRTVQSSIFAMLNDLGGKEVTITAGTPGISYLASDSLSWMNQGSGWSLNPTDGMYGLCAPLVRDGVPVKMKAMEQIYTADDLSDVTLLLASYDTSVPLSEEVNIAIADWVRKGGTLLYISGYNQYWDVEDYFFWAEDVTPLDNLFKHLGLEDIRVFTASDNGVRASTRIGVAEDTLDIFANHAISAFANYTVTFEGATTPLLTAGNRTLAFEEFVDDGQIIVVGIPTAAFAQYKGGSSMLRTLVEYALYYTDYEYASTELMVAKRGDYVIAHAFDTAQELEGTYINLYDPNLCILEDPTVPAEDSLILVDISDKDLSVPRLGYVSAEIAKDSLVESADKISYTVTSAGNTIICNRLLAPNGKYPTEISVTSADGKQLDLLSFVWDAESKSLRFTFDGSVEPIKVEVSWGDKMGSFSSASYSFDEVDIVVNNTNKDAKYLISNTASANSSLRFCDLKGELVYCFDITEYIDPVYNFYISQNYIIEVSGDGESWEIIADFSQGGTVEHIRDASNATTLSIDPSDYPDVEDSEELYVRVRNSNTSMGWGGTVSRIVIRHKVQSDASAGETGEWLKGKNPSSSIDDDAIITPSSASDDEKKYLVKTENGVNYYKRKVATNQSNADLDFILINTSEANANYRYCDTTRQLVYIFDLTDMKDCTLSFDVFQNYIVDVSCDNEEWEEVANYYDISGGVHTTSGGNNATVKIDPDEYDCFDTGVCYVRIRNCDTSKGWGGTVRSFTMEYTKAAK